MCQLPSLLGGLGQLTFRPVSKGKMGNASVSCGAIEKTNQDEVCPVLSTVPSSAKSQ